MDTGKRKGFSCLGYQVRYTRPNKSIHVTVYELFLLSPQNVHIERFEFKTFIRISLRFTTRAQMDYIINSHVP